MSGGDLYVVGPGRLPEQGPGPARWPTAVTDREQRSDNAAHHRVAERIGLYLDLQEAAGSCHAETLQFSDRRCVVAAAAVRREIVPAEQGLTRPQHRVLVQRARPVQRVGAAQRFYSPRRVTDPVDIAAPECGEPGIESGRYLANLTDADIVREHTGQPGP